MHGGATKHFAGLVHAVNQMMATGRRPSAEAPWAGNRGWPLAVRGCGWDQCWFCQEFMSAVRLRSRSSGSSRARRGVAGVGGNPVIDPACALLPGILSKVSRSIMNQAVLQ